MTSGRPISTLERLRPRAGARVGADFGALRSVRPRDLAIRFAFGFAVSVVAGGVSIAFGPSAGGMFLAFPAILPATLTLIDSKEGRHPAESDALGAIVGSAALGIFGLVSWLLLRRTNPVVAELAALTAWITTAVTVYLAGKRAFGRR
jgi:Protein of unknown function (DUF3147)